MLEPEVKRKLEADVARFYEQAGAAFASSRHAPWDVMDLLARQVKAGETLVDIGAGNGRLADVLPQGVNYVGIEPSSALRQASKHSLRGGSLPHLDLPDDFADAAACIAVLHHIPSCEQRAASVAELQRILKPGGLLLCTVWNLRAKRFFLWRTFLSAWLRLPGVPHGEPGDLLYPWRAQGRNDERYVHAFTSHEFKHLFDAKQWIVEQSGAYGNGAWQYWTKGRNLVALVRKV